MNETQRLYPHRMYTREEAQAAFDRDAAKVLSARQDKRDAELRRERKSHDLITSGALGVSACGSRCCDGRRSARHTVTSDIDPVSGMITNVAQVVEYDCNKRTCLDERMKHYRIFGSVSTCRGECEWTEGFPDGDCYE